MGDAALNILTREVTALPYVEQEKLLRVLTASLDSMKKERKQQLDFDSYVIPCERADFADSYVQELRENDRI